jgi:hypothetical protein
MAWVAHSVPRDSPVSRLWMRYHQHHDRDQMGKTNTVEAKHCQHQKGHRRRRADSRSRFSYARYTGGIRCRRVDSRMCGNRSVKPACATMVLLASLLERWAMLESAASAFKTHVYRGTAKFPRIHKGPSIYRELKRSRKGGVRKGPKYVINCQFLKFPIDTPFIATISSRRGDGKVII